MGFLKKIFGSRITWFLIGILVGAIILPIIPEGTVGGIFKFIWSQKWGVLIGIGIIVLVTKLRKVKCKYRIVREDDDEDTHSSRR